MKSVIIEAVGENPTASIFEDSDIPMNTIIHCYMPDDRGGIMRVTTVQQTVGEPEIYTSSNIDILSVDNKHKVIMVVDPSLENNDHIKRIIDINNAKDVRIGTFHSVFGK